VRTLARPIKEKEEEEGVDLPSEERERSTLAEPAHYDARSGDAVLHFRFDQLLD
jgi:hypothetical protein